MSIKKFIKDVIDYQYTHKKFNYHRLFDSESDLMIFDVGANIGQSVYKFREFFPSSTIHCFEIVNCSVETELDMLRRGELKNEL